MAWARTAALGEAGRDTDADWRRLAQTEPYWAVLASPEFRREALGLESLDAFYASGRPHIEAVAETLGVLVGGPLKVRRALDFGSGVGRLAEAMTAYADDVTGYDVAPGMLEIARARPLGSRIRYVDSLPEGPFDWINSHIVFQHIPPQRGMALLELLLQALAPGGFVSLHFTVGREAGLKRSALRRLVRRFAPHPPGVMSMYDYDLPALLQRFAAHGVPRTLLETTDHGGHHGVVIYGRRDPARAAH